MAERLFPGITDKISVLQRYYPRKNSYLEKENRSARQWKDAWIEGDLFYASTARSVGVIMARPSGMSLRLHIRAAFLRPRLLLL